MRLVFRFVATKGRNSLILVLALMLGASGCNDAQVPETAPPKPVQAALAVGAWQAGVAVEPSFAPVGLSLGGFGFRIGPNGRFNEHLGAAVGRYEQPLIKALAIGNGHGLVIFVKVPLIFATDLLRRRALAHMQAATGYDFSDALILSATHTHSGPARFWALPEGVGLFGLDEFDPAVVEAIATRIAAAAERAWRAMAPARIGAEELIGFDPDNRISRDRRAANDNLYTDVSDPTVYRDGDTFKSKDRRMWILRVDAADGTPLAAAIRFGIHGTVLAHQVYAEDAPGMIERAAEALWGVPTVLFLQGAAGDVSPAGDDDGRDGQQQVEAVAVRAARAGLSLWRAIPTEAEGVLAVAHRRRNLDRYVLGYSDNEFGRGTGAEFQPYAWGGFQCGSFGGHEGDDGNPDTVQVDGDLGCLGIDELQGVLTPPEQWELPLGELSTAVLSAVQIGSWHLVTLPGEPVSQMDTRLHAAAASIGVERLVLLGYAQHHLLYLTPAEDWFQGGYEAAQNIWGWKLGEFLINEQRELLQRLDAYGSEPAWDGDPLLPLKREAEMRTQVPQATGNPAWLSLETTTTTRLGTVVGAWRGGDPWIDPATVQLLDESGNVVVPADGFGWRLTAPLAGNLGDYEVLLELGVELPDGLYRLAVAGKTWSSGQVTDYTLLSPPFQVGAGPLLTVTGTVHGADVRLWPAWRPHPTVYQNVATDALDRFHTAGMRMVTDSVGPDTAAPLWDASLQLEATWQPSGVAVTATAQRDPVCACYRTTLPPPLGSTALAIAVGGLRRQSDYNATAVTVPVQ